MTSKGEKEHPDDWDATWEGNRRSLLDAGMAATPAQRLAWLEEAIELAYRSGALPDRPDPFDESPLDD